MRTGRVIVDTTCLKIPELIPHQGAMCLLDTIESWDDRHIVCVATSHRRIDNPLRDRTGLRSLCAIEYGAQAIAAHAALLGLPSGQGSGVGVLAAVNDIITTVSHLDSIEGPLRIRADAILLHGNGRIYDVMVHDNGRTLLSGRLSVMIPTASAQTSPRRQLDGVE